MHRVKLLARNLYRRFPWLDPQIAFISNLPPKAKVLDLGSHKGFSIRKWLDVRPDLKFTAVDIIDRSEDMPMGVHFYQMNCTKTRYPFRDGSFDAVTIVHLLEHLPPGNHNTVIREIYRVLKLGGEIYAETPGLRSLLLPSFRIELHRAMPANFFDDPSHVTIFTLGRLFYLFHDNGFVVKRAGIHRNWLKLLYSPLWIIAGALARRRDWFLAGIKALVGWGIYVIAQKPPTDGQLKDGT